MPSISHSGSDTSLSFRPPLVDDTAQSAPRVDNGSFLVNAGREGAARLRGVISRTFARVADCLNRNHHVPAQPDTRRRVLLREDSGSQAPRALLDPHPVLAERSMPPAMLAASRSSSVSAHSRSSSLSGRSTPSTLGQQADLAAALKASGDAALQVAAGKPGSKSPVKEPQLPPGDWSI